ncbi:MAG: hypothetical protein JWM95_3524, partial [Gemmatimonadetes bacterium]|nr:hypothetical protein [Gemmatimonadota bacterium]
MQAQQQEWNDMHRERPEEAQASVSSYIVPAKLSLLPSPPRMRRLLVAVLLLSAAPLHAQSAVDWNA